MFFKGPSLITYIQYIQNLKTFFGGYAGDQVSFVLCKSRPFKVALKLFWDAKQRRKIGWHSSHFWQHKIPMQNSCLETLLSIIL